MTARSAALLGLLLLLAAGCSRNDDPVSIAVDREGVTPADNPGAMEKLAAQRPAGAANQLYGGDLEEFYFVWSNASVFHPFGEYLDDWWTYPAIPYVLSHLRSVSHVIQYPDDYSRYLDSLQASAYMGKYERTVDTTVHVDWLDDDVAVVSVTSFRANSVGEERGDTTGSWSEFVDAMKATEGAKATILDLRGNPGGTMTTCLGIADEILGEVPFVIVWSGWSRFYEEVPEYTTYAGTPGGSGEGRNWVFLQDSGSASCSEVVLSSVRTSAAGPIVGKRSFGKGIGQSLIDTPRNGLLILTTFEIFAADSSSYHASGIEPDTLVSDPENQLAVAYALARASFAASGAADSSGAALPDSAVAPPPPDLPDFGGLQRRLDARRVEAEPEMTVLGTGLRGIR